MPCYIIDSLISLALNNFVVVDVCIAKITAKQREPLLLNSFVLSVNYENVYIVKLLLNWLISSCPGLRL